MTTGARGGSGRAVAPDRTDEQLLTATGQGDQAAFGALYDRFVAPAYAVVRRVVRDPDHSAEVTQEVMVEVWRTAARFDPARGAARTWVLTMAHRRAVDRVRSEQSTRDRTERVAARDRERDVDVVADQVELDDEYATVRAALAGLTDLQREAIELAYVHGHTYQEVAELLGAPLGTVKTRMRDGLIRLRDALGVSR